jgi:hypothetical protein
VVGPDSFPYLLIETKEQGSGEVESFSKLLHWAMQRGIGLAINPYREPEPDLVLSYGMVWALVKRGEYWRSVDVPKDEFIAGQPDEAILPKEPRKILRQFLLDQGVLTPRFMAVVNKGQIEFCFSLESLGNPDDKEQAGVAEAISWFLPPNVLVTLAREAELSGFVLV